MTSAFAPERAVPSRAPRPARPPRERLRPATGGRPAGRRSPAVPVLVGAGIVIAALFALAVMHALLIGGQIRLDDMQREVASETEEIRRLRLRVAELEAPHRVLDVARDRLGMVQPTEVGYLAPAAVQLPEQDADPVRVAPAERPAPPPTAEELGTAADRSADQDADAEADDTAADTDDTDDTEDAGDTPATAAEVTSADETAGGGVE